MKKLVPGDSARISFQLRNTIGDFADPNTYLKIECILYELNSVTGLAKFTTETPTPTGWKAAAITDEDANLTDDTVVLYLDSEDTKDSPSGVLVVQVSRYLTNASYESGYTKTTKSGKIAKIIKGKNA